MSMPKLTASSEKLISNALTKIADLVNAGEHPNDAIVKIATEMRLPAGHIGLMARAYNNGRSIGHFKAANSLAEKAAAFNLADNAVILERMFPSTFKSAAEQEDETAVSDDYSMPPSQWRSRHEKAAAKHVDLREAWQLEKVAEYPKLLRDRQALSHANELRKQADQQRHKAIKLAYDVAYAVDAITDYFRAADSLPFVTVHDNAKAVLGERAHRLMTKLSHEHPQFTKRVGRPHNCDWTQPPYSLIKQALDRVDEFNAVRADMESFEKTAKEQIQETLRPFVQCPTMSVITGSVWEHRSQTEKQAVGPLGIGLGAAIGGGAGRIAQAFKPESKEELIQDRLKELGSTEHEQNLRAIQAQTMLQDLMMNDPIISGYDPEQVMNAYNQISQFAPRAANKRLMAQALLRKYLEQGQALDPFDMGQLMDIEKQLTNVSEDESSKENIKAPSNAPAV